MRKTLLLVATSGSLVALATVALPAFAGSTTPADTTTASPPAASPPAPDALNLDAIPVQAVTGPLSVKGVGDSEDDDAPRLATGGRSGAYDGAGLEEDGEYDD